METLETRNMLEAFWALRDRSSPHILGLLKELNKRREGAQWSEIETYCKEKSPQTEAKTTKEALKQLVSFGFVNKKGDRYYISVRGLWAFAEYEKILAGPQLETIPRTVQDLMEIEGYPGLHPTQREFVSSCFPPKCNLSIFASPSAGKTFMAECCMLDELRKFGRVAYITPYKALNRQKFEHFRYIFQKLGFSVERTDGDMPTSKSALAKANVVVSTFERALGGFIRSEDWITKSTMVIVDELAILGQEERGSTLDLLITFLKSKTKLITLSVHVGNSEKICNWLRSKPFDGQVKELVKEYIVEESIHGVLIEDKEGITKKQFNGRSAIKSILRHVQDRPSILPRKYKSNEIILMLVGKRADAESYASEVAKLIRANTKQLAKTVVFSSDEQTRLIRKLYSTVAQGVAFHHAGLTHEVRCAVEDLLNYRKIRAIASTPTLSYGVDFPIDHVVIFIDTFEFRKRYDFDDETSPLKKVEYIQYRGRAGRMYQSRVGSVYIVSRKRTADNIRKNLLAKKMEETSPPAPNQNLIDRIVLHTMVKKNKLSRAQIIKEGRAFIGELLAFQALDPKLQRKNIWRRKISLSISRLSQAGFLDLNKDKFTISSLGRQVHGVDWPPNDLKYVIDYLRMLEKESSEENLLHGLLFVCSRVGLMRYFDKPRVNSFVGAYLGYCKRHGIAVRRPPEILRCQAKAWVLKDWIDEKSLRQITQRLPYVDDADVFNLAGYATIEMYRIVSIAKILNLPRVVKMASALIPQLRHGVKSDLVGNETISLLRLRCVGRRRARILFKKGYRDVTSVLAKILKNERQFRKSCNLRKNEADALLSELKKTVKYESQVVDHRKISIKNAHGMRRRMVQTTSQ